MVIFHMLKSDIKTFIKNINPLKDMENNSRIEYCIQKILAFIIIYLVTAVMMEGIIILIFTMMGHDLLHGDMPAGNVVELLPLYGFIGFGIVTILYIKLIEKQSLSGIMWQLNGRSVCRFIKRFIFGGFMVGVTVILLWITGNYDFSGFGKPNSMLLQGLAAYVIQGTAEEIMCRGFLFHSLNRRIDGKFAIIISTVAFMMPHLISLSWDDGILAVVEIMNLAQVSILFSLVMINDDTLLSACGLHAGWNYVLAFIFGLQVSGREKNEGVFRFILTGKNYITGSNYGIEASVVLIPVILILNVLYIRRINGKQDKYGV